LVDLTYIGVIINKPTQQGVDVMKEFVVVVSAVIGLIIIVLGLELLVSFPIYLLWNICIAGSFHGPHSVEWW